METPHPPRPYTNRQPVAADHNAAPKGGPPQQMVRPVKPPNCPEGLEYLTQLEQLTLKQQVEMGEVFLNYKGENQYEVLNGLGELIYSAQEESDWCERNCCSSNFRSFNVRIRDNFQREVIHLNREGGIVEVSSPPGTVIGSMLASSLICGRSITIKDSAGNIVFLIKVPLITIGDVDFPIMTPDGNTQVGMINKQLKGAMREIFTDADTFNINFKKDLDVRIKATLLGAMFFIDYLYFETAPR